jgi:hypothetical protein
MFGANPISPFKVSTVSTFFLKFQSHVNIVTPLITRANKIFFSVPKLLKYDQIESI